MPRYRLRIYGAGEDGATPPLNEQPCVFDAVVEATEEIPEDLRWAFNGAGEVALFVHSSAEGMDGAYHGGPHARVAHVMTPHMLGTGSSLEELNRYSAPLFALVDVHGGLRAAWEPAPAA